MAMRASGDLHIRPLDEQHDRIGFACGVESLDRYLKTQAGQDVRRKANAVFVMSERDQPARILGYYTLCAMALSQGEVPEAARKHIPRYPLVSATLIGRLAVSKDRQGQSLGAVLLADALRRAFRERQHGRIFYGRGRCSGRVGGRLLRRAWLRATARFTSAGAADASCRWDG